MVGAMMSLTARSQAVLQVETNTGSTQYIYGKNAKISFWGLPNNDELNADLTVTISSVGATTAYSYIHVTASSVFDDLGICITENENDTPEYVKSSTGEVTYNGIRYSTDMPYYSLKGTSQTILNNLESEKTYYVKPYAVLGDQLMLGSEKSFTTKTNIQKFIANERLFGDWYAGTQLRSVANVYPLIYIVPTAKAWEAYCEKYKTYLGEDAVSSALAKKALTTEWFKHLSAAEASLMKADAVLYDGTCEGGDVYVVDRLCDDLLPELIKASGNINLEDMNWDYSENCWSFWMNCDESYGIEDNRYQKVETYNETMKLAYNLPFMLLPNRQYNLTITIAPNTADIENALPNLFNVQLTGSEGYVEFTNPDTSGEHGEGKDFIYGGKKLETITIPINTKGSEYWAMNVLRFVSTVTEEQKAQYSNNLCIAKITLSPVMEDAVQGDADFDGVVNQDDVETVAAAVVLSSGNNEEVAEEQPSTDFTGDGKTLIDDVVALVNFLQTGEFYPASSKARARALAVEAPAFTTDKAISITVGENTALNVDMNGVADYTAVSFDIKVPQGVCIAADENGKPKVTLGSIATTKHNVKTALQEDKQTISVACFADDNSNFTNDVGTLFTVVLTTDGNIETNEDAQISFANCMVTKRTLQSALLDEYIINAGIVNGIENIETNNDAEDGITIVGYYTFDGMQIIRPQRGINIVKLSDGSVKKLYMK